MEQKITIEVPEGKKAIYNSETQTVEFIDIEHVRSKSWEEFCENHPQITYEYYLQQSQNMVIYATTETRMNFRHARHGEQSKCLLETREDAEGILALIQLTRLHDEWVGDWKPDYADNYEPKWHICFKSNNIDIDPTTTFKRLLAFPTYDMAEEFIDCFKDLILTAKKFI